MTIKRIFRFALLALISTGVLLGGCTPARNATPEQQVERVWPEPPEQPRIRFEKSISSAEDLGIEKSFWKRLGEFITGASSTRLVRPMAVVMDTRNEIMYVADPGARGVHRFNLHDSSYKLLYREKNLPLTSPVGMALGPDNQVFIADSGLGQLFVATPDADFLSPVKLEPGPQQPTGVLFEQATGYLYIVDTTEHAIKVYSGAGSLVRQFGRRGHGPGEFNFPTALWQDRQGHLLVTDSLNFRIQKLDTGGRFISRFGQLGDASGDMSRPKGVATDSSGHVYVVDSMFHAFQIFDDTGELLLILGSQGHGAGEFWLPTGIFIAPDDRIYISDSHNRRVQIFRYIGGKP
ncbi:MAG TPA: 6-bladed beta-propeller [Gammaproteobacteria bacterium]|nr:6-bladed beta-propeller [Gammaproteobacteria bacterium]